MSGGASKEGEGKKGKRTEDDRFVTELVQVINFWSVFPKNLTLHSSDGSLGQRMFRSTSPMDTRPACLLGSPAKHLFRAE